MTTDSYTELCCKHGRAKIWACNADELCELFNELLKSKEQEIKRKLAEKYQWCKENRYHEVCTKDSYFYLFQSTPEQDFPELFKKAKTAKEEKA